MPDLKVQIGGKNYHISCNPGEEDATTESANLFDQEAELIQTQLGHLSEEKMLLLSGLLLGDKVRVLKHEIVSLEETLRVTQSKLNEFSSKANASLAVEELKSSSENVQSGNVATSKDNLTALQAISDLLDTIILELEHPSENKSDELSSSRIIDGGQASFL